MRDECPVPNNVYRKLAGKDVCGHGQGNHEKVE